MLVKRKFADGGFMADGGGVDPVSGNDVPVGSLKEEVRDDVDAKLSPGEFVIPADVVRFIGLERLMELRDKAKEGLQRMNEVGQMGNAEEVGAKSTEPFSAEGEEEDNSGFETEIDDILKEDEGQQTEKAFAAGGFMSGEDISKAPKNPMVDVRYFKNKADGRVMFITHINGKPMTAIPDGFEPTDRPTEQLVGKAADVAKEAATDGAAKASTTSSAPFGRDSEGMAYTKPTGGLAGNGTNLTDAQWERVFNLREKEGLSNDFDKQGLKDFGKAVASMLGGPASFLATAGKMVKDNYDKDLTPSQRIDKQLDAAEKAAEQRSSTALNTILHSDTGAYRSSYVPSGMKDSIGSEGWTSAVNTTAAARLQRQGATETPAADGEPTTTPVSSGSSYTPTARSEGGNATETKRSETGGAEGATRAFATQVGYNPSGFNTPSSGDSDSDGGSDGLAKGGLIAKRQLPAKKQKGKGISMSRK